MFQSEKNVSRPVAQLSRFEIACPIVFPLSSPLVKKAYDWEIRRTGENV